MGGPDQKRLHKARMIKKRFYTTCAEKAFAGFPSPGNKRLFCKPQWGALLGRSLL